MARELDRRVVEAERAQPELVERQQGLDEAEVVQHARVRAQGRVVRDHVVREGICSRSER